MAEQTVKSKPLYDESEEEKRKRIAAQNYLSSAGIGGPVMAQDVLNKPQARIIGDTLVGKAAGISASEWDKRDKSVASGNNPLMPTRKMQPIGEGVMADEGTKERYDKVTDYMNDTAVARSARDADRSQAFYTNLNEKQKKITEAKRAAMSPEASKARFENFKNDIAEREATNKQVDAELKNAAAEERLATRNFRALRRHIARGRFVDPETLQKAADYMAETRNALGNSRDVGVRRAAVSSNVDQLVKRRQEREAMGRYSSNPGNPYGPVSREATSAAAPIQDPFTEEDYAKIRKKRSNNVANVA